MPEADIAIVGGGPAGAAAAIFASQHGLRTVLLDNGPDHGERPGETLHPGIEPLFQRLGVNNYINAAAKIRHDGHWTNRSGRVSFVRFGADQTGSWRGFQIRRSELRRILLRKANEAGVTVICLRAIRPVIQQAKVCGVDTLEGVITCRILIDASGGSHWLARTTAVPVNFLSPRLIAWYGWARSERASYFAAPILTIDHVGWSWIAQVDSNLCAWTRLDFQTGRAVRLQKPAVLKNFEVVAQERGADVTWRSVRLHAGNGFFRVGDAGAVLDPADSHGVLRAVMTGMAAAHSCARILRHGHGSVVEAAAFDLWVKRMLIKDTNALQRLYGHGTVLRR